MRCLFLHHDPSALEHFRPLLPEFTHTVDHPGGAWDVLLRWGSRAGPDAQVAVNRLQALEVTDDHPQVHRLLALNHIGCRRTRQADDGSWSVRGVAVRTRFRVHLFDLRSVSVSRIGGARRSLSRKRARHLRFIARRTLYVLGLHFGAVDIALTRKNRLVVLEVNPSPTVDRRLAKRYARAINGYLERLRVVMETLPSELDAKIVLGADPEFMLRKRSNGRMRFASDYFPRHGSVGYDIAGVRVRDRRRHPIAELRPSPSTSPAGLVDNIRLTLRRAVRMAPDRSVEWVAGALPFRKHPIGGHIHFSRVPLTTDLVWALDTYLAVPSMLLEEVRKNRKRRSRYGYLGEYRREGHGGFEYRTLSSWLSSAYRARATLALAKIVATEYPRLNRRLLIGFDAQHDFYRGHKSRFRDRIHLLWQDMEHTHTYMRYREHVDPVQQLIAARRRWKDRIDLKRRWGL